MLQALPRSPPGCNVTLQFSILYDILPCHHLLTSHLSSCLSSPHPLSQLSSPCPLPHLAPYHPLPHLTSSRPLYPLSAHCPSLHLTSHHPSSQFPYPPLRYSSWGTGTTSQIPSSNKSLPSLSLINRTSLLRGLGSPPGLYVALSRTSIIMEQCPPSQRQ